MSTPFRIAFSEPTCRQISRRRSLPTSLGVNVPTIYSALSSSCRADSKHGFSQSAPKPSCPNSPKSNTPSSLTTPSFWASKSTWRRSSVNTLRCLVGCTLGDFSSMWYLQAFHHDIGMEIIMGISSKSFIPPDHCNK